MSKEGATPPKYFKSVVLKMIMEEQLKGQINTTERQLLWDIRAEFKRLNELLQTLLNGPEANKHDIMDRTVRPAREGTEFKYKCVYCGKGHNNKGELMACAKKKKREGVKVEKD